jgi:glycosyltransferase involved in cell wall biosynthesis
MTEEQFGWRVHAQCPEAVRVLDTEDLHSLRYAREESFRKNDDRIHSYLSSDIAKREIASIHRCDLSLIISESEIHLLHDFYKVKPEILLYLPYMLEPVTVDDRSKWPGFEERVGFMTIGNFRHKPNLDAVEFLRTEIWPIIRKSLPDALMNVYGAYPRQQVKEWDKPSDGFLICGRVDDANIVSRKARLCLAPIRFGAGLKGKLVEAMLNGTPSVTTSMGAEGIHGAMDWPGAIADNPATFAEAAVESYTNSSIWTAAQLRGCSIINERFSKSRFYSIFLNRLSRINSELELHRSNNFIGAMLMHHTMASTRFMSRWIEEKNR